MLPALERQRWGPLLERQAWRYQFSAVVPPLVELAVPGRAETREALGPWRQRQLGSTRFDDSQRIFLDRQSTLVLPYTLRPCARQAGVVVEVMAPLLVEAVGRLEAAAAVFGLALQQSHVAQIRRLQSSNAKAGTAATADHRPAVTHPVGAVELAALEDSPTFVSAVSPDRVSLLQST
jgi:hypothetical protein